MAARVQRPPRACIPVFEIFLVSSCHFLYSWPWAQPILIHCNALPMRAPALHHVLRWSLLTAIACLLHGYWSSDVQASCGDYVWIAGHQGHLMGISRDGARGPEAAPMDSDHERAPCQGPNCSRRSAPVPAQPVAGSSAPRHDLGWSALAVLFKQPLSSRLAPAPVASRAVLLRGKIFRPPRVAPVTVG